MPESRGGVLREIAWLEICPWLILVRVFRLAIQLRMLLLSSAAVLVTFIFRSGGSSAISFSGRRPTGMGIKPGSACGSPTTRIVRSRSLARM